MHGNYRSLAILPGLSPVRVRQKSIPMNNLERHFYLSRGDWYDIFFQLLDSVPHTEKSKFEVWEPVDKSKQYVVIVVYGTPLDEEYCLNNKIWKTHEKIFNAFYLPKLNEYNVHSNSNSENETNSLGKEPLLVPAIIVKPPLPMPRLLNTSVVC